MAGPTSPIGSRGAPQHPLPACLGTNKRERLRSARAAFNGTQRLDEAREAKMDPTYNLNGGFKPTLKRFADLDGPDFFPTPAWATHALLESERFEHEI